MKVLLVRILALCYLPVTVLLYFAFVRGPSQRIALTMAALSEARRSEELQRAVAEANQLRNRQREQLRALVERFRAMAEGFDTASLPPLLGALAQSSGAELVKFEVKDVRKRQGATLAEVELYARGQFASLLDFLSALEGNSRRLVLTRRVRIQPAKAEAGYELFVLFDIMTDSGVQAAAETPKAPSARVEVGT